MKRGSIDVLVSLRFVNDYTKTRIASIVFRIVLAIISGYVAYRQGVEQGVSSAVCLYWVVLFLLNMWELGLVNVDIERQKKAAMAACEKMKKEIEESGEEEE